MGCKIQRQVKSDAQIQDCFGGFGESSVAIDANVNISCQCKSHNICLFCIVTITV